MSALIEAARAALSELEAVLCDPEGRAGIRGSDADNAIIDGALTSLRAALAAAEAQPVGEPAPHAMQQLTAALQADPDYAWSWHCNLAMPVMDVTGVTHRVANEAGARLMRHLFDIDITKHPHYQVDTAPPAQPAAQPLTDAWRQLYRRAINEANGLTNYVEDRPELRSAERRISKIEDDARTIWSQP